MNRDDRIDASLAKHFAWSFARTGSHGSHGSRGVMADLEQRLRAARGSTPPPPLEPHERDAAPPPPAPLDEHAIEAARLRVRRACRPLAAAVEKAWALDQEGHETRGAQAAKRLLARAERLDHVLAGFDEQPVVAVRLVRLFVRHGAKMTDAQRERAAEVATLLPLDDPEAGDLLVEVARAGDRVMTSALLADDEWAPELGDARGVAARLADVIEGPGTGNASRVAAIDLLSLLDDASRALAVTALRTRCASRASR